MSGEYASVNFKSKNRQSEGCKVMENFLSPPNFPGVNTPTTNNVGPGGMQPTQRNFPGVNTPTTNNLGPGGMQPTQPTINLLPNMNSVNNAIVKLNKTISIPYFSDMHGRKIEQVYVTPNKSYILYVCMDNNFVEELRALNNQELIPFKSDIYISSYNLLIDLPSSNSIYNNNTIIPVKVMPNEQTADYEINCVITIDNNIQSYITTIKALPNPYDNMCSSSNNMHHNNTI